MQHFNASHPQLPCYVFDRAATWQSVQQNSGLLQTLATDALVISSADTAQGATGPGNVGIECVSLNRKTHFAKTEKREFNI